VVPLRQRFWRRLRRRCPGLLNSRVGRRSIPELEGPRSSGEKGGDIYIEDVEEDVELDTALTSNCMIYTTGIK